VSGGVPGRSPSGPTLGDPGTADGCVVRNRQGVSPVSLSVQNYLVGIRWDETWHRLSEWTSGQGASERLAAQLLLDDGFTRLDPSHPLGGRDGKKDAIAWRDDQKWIMAVYFPRGRKPVREIRSKFLGDAQGVVVNGATGIAFVTNQELTLTEREGLQGSVAHNVEIYHLERITTILDKPSMQSVRSQFLGISAYDSPLASTPIIVHTIPDWATPDRLYGREVELANLSGFLSDEPITADAATICVISGMPGVGKTALAFHASAQPSALAHFSGGIIALDFSGYNSTIDRRIESQQVLSSILLAMESSDIDPDANKMHVRYHNLLKERHESNRPVLLVFDNVADVSQIGPLIPASSTHRTLVTSRNSLAARLPNAVNLEVGTLHIKDAIAFLAEQSGALSGTAEPQSADDSESLATRRVLADICGRLPIALELVAEILKSEPNLAPGELARELEAGKTRLAGLEFEDGAVRTVFRGSYARLTEETARCFRYMAIHPGVDVSARSLASMLSVRELDTRRQIRRLESSHLIVREPGAQTWQMHDLLRLYGQELFESLDGTDAVNAALGRLGEYYFDKLEQANEWLNASSMSGKRDAFEGRAGALAWLEDEVFSVVACAKHAWNSGSYDMAWRLGIDIALYLGIIQDHAGSSSMGEVALAAARELRDAEKEAGALNNIGLVLNSRGQTGEAKAQFMLARKKYREVGDLSGEATVMLGLSEALRAEGSVRAAVGPLRRAIRLYMENRDGHGAGFALTNLGIALREDGQYKEAIEQLSLALKVHEESGARRAEASTLTHLGTALSQAGKHSEAIPYLLRSFACAEEVGDRAGSASAAINTGNVYRKMGQEQEALRYYSTAGDICEELEDESTLGLVLWNRYDLYSKSGQGYEASEVLKRLHRIAPHRLPVAVRRRLYG
jgi:tetratricopeptide (TPR) repeat protein